MAKLAIALNADVIIFSRSAKKLEQAAATISDRIRTYAADAEATAQILKALASLDYIVVTASGSAPATSMVDTPADKPYLRHKN